MSIFKIKKNSIILGLIIVFLFSVSFFTNPKTSSAADCAVLSAKFIPAGEQNSPTWYLDANKPNVVVNIITENCEGRTIQVSITEEDGLGGGDDDLPDSGLDNRPITVGTANNTTMHLRGGEEACEAGPGWDCHYYISIYGLDTLSFASNGDANGDLWYECDTVCLDNWIVGDIFSPDVGEPLPPDPEATANTETTYTLLAPIPGVGTETCEVGPLDVNNQPTTVCKNIIDTAPSETNPCPFGKYLNIIIRLFLGICAVLAMVMIILGGLEYMTSELGSHKEAGKEKITHAILGLVLALGSYAILNTLNPELLKGICLDTLPTATIIVDNGESTASFVPIDTASLESLGISCPGTQNTQNEIGHLISISHSFIGNATYSRTKRNTFDASVPTAYFDCSSYVNQVYKCAGFASPGNNTTEIFSSSDVIEITQPIETITSQNGNSTVRINGNYNLQTGDIIGWKPTGNASGHALMYYGNGKTIEVTSPDEVINQATKIRPANHYSTRLKYLKKLHP